MKSYCEQEFKDKPHKCPVCEGRGGVKHPLTGLFVLAKCNICDGKGIVWR